MSGWDWLPAGLAAWCVLSVVLGLVIGPVLKRCSQNREALDER